VDKQGKLQGLGREVYDHIYEGQFKDNLYHGWGRFINHLGVYWGFWERGMRHGKGKFLANNGGVQEGNWNNGAFK
jgi:radial spoke head protein 1